MPTRKKPSVARRPDLPACSGTLLRGYNSAVSDGGDTTAKHFSSTGEPQPPSIHPTTRRTALYKWSSSAHPAARTRPGPTASAFAVPRLDGQKVPGRIWGGGGWVRPQPSMHPRKKKKRADSRNCLSEALHRRFWLVGWIGAAMSPHWSTQIPPWLRHSTAKSDEARYGCNWLVGWPLFLHARPVTGRLTTAASMHGSGNAGPCPCPAASIHSCLIAHASYRTQRSRE